jgi:transposase
VGQAVRSTKDEKQSAELIEAKSGILRPRSTMRRLEEERDLLKKPHGTLPGSPSKVPLYQ